MNKHYIQTYCYSYFSRLTKILLCLLLTISFSYSQVASMMLTKNGNASISSMLARTMPAVVSLLVQGELPGINDPFLQSELRRYHPEIQINGSKFLASGSGVIIDANQGYIITNAHVVDQAKVILITLSDSRSFKARVIGVDDAYDVALLQINAKHLTALPWGDSNALKVGDFVAAIGSPFQLNQTVTSGIISALNRTDIGIEGLENFIQTDAPINLGNSGGALVNMQGQLIGINTALAGPNAGNVGIGFAIPASIVHSIVDQLLKYGSVKRGALGIGIETLTPDLADALNISHQTGAVITQVVPYSAAYVARLKRGDVIIQANGQTVENEGTIRNIIGLLRVGDSVNLKILRDGAVKNVAVTIDTPDHSESQLRDANPYLYGVTTQNIVLNNPAFGYVHGVQVLSVDYESPAWISSLRQGDVIVSANNQAVGDVATLQQIATHSKNPEGLLLTILRGSGFFFIVISQ